MCSQPLVMKYLAKFRKNMAEAYCVKCRQKREMKDAKEIEMKGKGGMVRRAMKGVCPVCGTGMYRIMGKK